MKDSVLHQKAPSEGPFSGLGLLIPRKGSIMGPPFGKSCARPQSGVHLATHFRDIYHAQVVSIVEPLFDKCHVCPRGQVHPGTPVHLGTPFQNKRHACGTSIMLVPKAGCTLEPLFGRSVMLVPKSVVHRGIVFGTNIMFVPKAG